MEVQWTAGTDRCCSRFKQFLNAAPSGARKSDEYLVGKLKIYSFAKLSEKRFRGD